jgi:uncharacterized protein YecA (UPF0149 family)
MENDEASLPLPLPPFPTSAKLKAYLGLYTKETGEMGYYSALGFLFAIACGPKTVPLGDWMARILGKRALTIPRFEKLALIEELQILWEAVALPAALGVAELPPDCSANPDPMANFDDRAPLHQWSMGFCRGFTLIEMDWRMSVRRDVSPAASRVFANALARLTCFASREQAEGVVSVAEGNGTVEDLATLAQQEITDAMGGYARIGFERRLRREGPIPPQAGHRVGRNEPCPCGSGKKYKKCCLVVH